MSNKIVADIGTEGPTDCTLTLWKDGQVKEYLIDSAAWLIIDLALRRYDDDVDQQTLYHIVWDNFDKDIVQ